jgi:hypothetical protein
MIAGIDKIRTQSKVINELYLLQQVETDLNLLKKESEILNFLIELVYGNYDRDYIIDQFKHLKKEDLLVYN